MEQITGSNSVAETFVSADFPLGKWALADRKKAVAYATAFGADYEARTRYLHLGKVALYQMS